MQLLVSINSSLIVIEAIESFATISFILPERMEMIIGIFSNPHAIFEDLKFFQIFRDISGKSAIRNGPGIETYTA